MLQEPGQDGVLPLSLRSIPANQWAHLCGRRVSSNSERGPFFLSCARLAWMPFFLFFESRLSVLRIGLCHWACYIVGKHWPCTHALARGRSTWVGPGRRFGSDSGGGIAASLLFGACISTSMDQHGVGGPLDREVCMYIPCLPWTMFVCVSSTLCSLPPSLIEKKLPRPLAPVSILVFPRAGFGSPWTVVRCGWFGTSSKGIVFPYCPRFPSLFSKLACAIGTCCCCCARRDGGRRRTSRSASAFEGEGQATCTSSGGSYACVVGTKETWCDGRAADRKHTANDGRAWTPSRNTSRAHGMETDQITAEQIVRDARSQQEELAKPPISKIADREELAEYQLKKRREFEDLVRRMRWSPGVWTKYAKFEESQQDFERARSVWERALEVDYRNRSMWLKYAEMEMRNRFVNHARNVWDRAVTLLPMIDQFW